MRTVGVPNVSKGFQLPFSGDSLLDQFSFIQLKNAGTTITAAKNDFGGGNGGASSLNVNGGSVKLFNAGTQSTGTVSFRQNGTQFFSTPTADTSQQVTVATQGGSGTLKLKQTGSSTNQTFTNKLYNLTTTQWLLIGGAVTAGVLLVAFLRK